MKPIAQTLLIAFTAATLLATGPVLAQDAAPATEAPATAAPAIEEAPVPDAVEGLATGEPVDADGNPLGQEYIKEVSGDWAIVCIRSGLSDDPCSLRQRLNDQGGNPVAVIDIVSMPPGRQVVAAGRIVTPLETLLTQQITLSVDGGAGKRYPFEFCMKDGCVSRVGFADGDVNAFRRGNAATVTIVPVLAPDQKVNAIMSLKGFTDGFKRLTELNLANQAAIEGARAQQ